MAPPSLRPPPPVLRLAQRVAASGGRALLVGGSVRDHLMGRSIEDWDIEVFGISESTLHSLLRPLGPVNAVGRAFAVFKVSTAAGEIDVSLPRRDSKVGPGHRGIQVEGDPDMTVEEAARRRDLTINAILVDLLSGEILDPWGGLRDLEAGVLRPVDPETFLEDPLRALRVVQFSARLGFTPTDPLLSLCRRARLDELPAERIRGEWRKLLLQGLAPSRGLAVARQTRILERLFPEAAATDAPAVDHALDRLAARPPLPTEGRWLAVLLATWLHRGDAETAEATLDRLLLHTWHGYPTRRAVVAAVTAWQEDPAEDRALRHLSTRVELTVALLVRWAVTGEVSALARLERARALGIAHESPTPLLRGRDLIALGVAPGPEMGALLKQVYRAQLDGAVQTPADALRAARALLDGE